MAEKKSSNKRRAHSSEREHAAVIARAYRERMPCVASRGPDGKPVVLPLTGDDLARQLETFAEFGTFRPEGELRDNFRAYCRIKFRELRAGGMKAEDAIAELAQSLDCGERTVRGHVYGKRPTK